MFDFTYWPHLPIDKADIYRNLEQALLGLRQHIQPLTLTQAKADDRIADLLIDFWTALDAAQQAIGENEPTRLLDTLNQLNSMSVRWGAYAAMLLRCGSLSFQLPTLRKKRVETWKVVQNLLNTLHDFGDENEMWHEIKKRTSEYSDALLTALRPTSIGGKEVKKNANDPRDKFCYDNLKKGRSLKWIMSRVQEHKRWEPLTTRQGVSAAAKRFAKRQGLPWPLSSFNIE